jgi:hypothetical protein
VSNASTTLATPARAGGERSPAYGDPRQTPQRRRGRSGITVTVLVALILSAVLQQVAFSYRTRAINRNRPESNPAASRVANLDSFSLALLLGGLRGPLVMFLWTQSESQKSEKDLESFDTQVELIRLLQPEFASVHLFQIWNKAYNISVQMASLANKYASILDAIEYGRRTDEMNPNDINIINAIGGLYAEKLGNSSEKEYYRKRVRTETLPVYKVEFPAARAEEFKRVVKDSGLDESRVRITTAGDRATAVLDKLGGDRVLAAFTGPDVTRTAVPRQSLRPKTQSGRRYEMDTILDEKGNILPQYLAPTTSVPAGTPGNNGAELQYLEQFQPFPQGLSPIALGYNYYKRSQVLARVNRQRHVQLSDTVIDNQAGLSLRTWSDEEWDRGRRFEQRGLGIAGTDRLPRELRTAKAAPDAKPADRASIDDAIFCYERASKAAAAAVPEFTSHVERFPTSLQNYASHIDTAQAVRHLTAADAAYLRAVAAPSADARKAALDQARAEYTQARRWFEILVLRYYVMPGDMAAIGYSQDKLGNLTPEQVHEIMDKFMARVQAVHKSIDNLPNAEDVREYAENLQRIQERLSLIK